MCILSSVTNFEGMIISAIEGNNVSDFNIALEHVENPDWNKILILSTHNLFQYGCEVAMKYGACVWSEMINAAISSKNQWALSTASGKF